MGGMVEEVMVLLEKALVAARRVLRGKRGVGYVDCLYRERAAGWLAPDKGATGPARLSLHIDGQHEMNVIADLERSDVLAVGLGPLKCGFDVPMPKRVRDGHPHLVELRVGRDGPLLTGGRLRITGDEGAGAVASVRAPEGVVFFDQAAAAIRGWAIGSVDVSIAFDDAAGEQLEIDREVPGFGGGNLGFLLPVPQRYRDGVWHEVSASHPDGTPLDGSPLRFRLAPARPEVSVTLIGPQKLEVSIHQGAENVSERLPQIMIDGAVVPHDPMEAGVVVQVPDGGRHLVVTLEGGAEGTVLARYVLEPSQVVAWRPPHNGTDDLLGTEIALFSSATAAFAVFCSAPDERFDALWYASSYTQTEADALIHYQQTGARAGLSPGPEFDEAAARALYPELAARVETGELPCLFALELELGRGALESLTGLTPEDRMPAPVSQKKDGPRARRSQQVVPTDLADPVRSIYAAWMLRLDVSDAVRAEIQADELALRKDLAVQPLEREPLVSIIMPSWNRAFTIGEAIQSVLEQRYQNWELLVCDDASEDRTSDVVHGFDDPRLRYMKFLKSNGAGARNKGLRFARGEYIAYLDSDNIWHPLFLEMMLSQLQSNPGRALAYSAYLDTETIGAQVKLRTISRPPFRPIRLAAKNFMDLNAIVHHRRLYDWMGGFDGALPRLQDWDLMLRYTSIFRPRYVNRIGVFYRRNAAWGQVTHLHQNSGAQNRVNEKSRQRQNGIHETLAVTWPRRARVSVIAWSGNFHGERLLAEGLSRLAAKVVDVDLIVPEEDRGLADMPAGVTQRVLPDFLMSDPSRAGYALASELAGRSVLSVGVPASILHQLRTMDPERLLRLRGSGEGAELRGWGANEKTRFHLGALPLPFPVAQPERKNLVFSLNGGPDVVTTARKWGLDLLVPPQASQAHWRHIRSGGETRVGNLTALPEQLGEVVLGVSLRPVSSLDPYSFSLLSGLQGQGIPLAVPVDGGLAHGTSLARQWIEARAAYELKKTDPEWVFEKCRKLLDDVIKMDTMRERSRIVHAIAEHPDLLQSRLADALYHQLFGLQDRETFDDHT